MAIFNDGLVRIAEQYLRKGSKVYIEGQLQTRKWQDQSGADRYTTEIVLQGFGAVLTMLDAASGGQQGRPGRDDHLSEPPIDNSSGLPSRDFDDDEIPF